MSHPMWPLLAAMGALGLAVGSFLNVVIYRVPREESIVAPGSHCPSCDTALKARHNVPVMSWLMLRGRCAFCHAGISARYPLVEAGTALLFAAITLRFGLSVQLPAYLFLGAVGITLAMIDFDVRRLPDTIVLPSYVVSVLLLMPAGAVDGDWRTATRGLAGMFALAGIYLVLAVAYPRGLTIGDVKLAGLLGLYLGWLSWEAALIGAFGGLLIGAVGGAMFGSSRHRQGGAIAFAPCMVSAAVLALFVTVPISTWYASVLAVTT